MDTFNIETAQNVNIQQNVAPLSSRIWAYLVDMLIILTYFAISFFILNILGFLDNEYIYVFYTLFGLPIFFYSLLFETLMNGQTPGKYYNNIRVTKIDGAKPTFGSYLIRWMLRIIDISFASGSVAMLCILLNGKGQRLGDLAAGTTVISLKKTISIENTLIADIADDYRPTYPQVTLLSDKDIQFIKNLYKKSIRKGNHNIILKLFVKVTEITGITTAQKPIEFIDTIIKDYNYYTQNS